MASDPLAELGSFLTATEAERLALQFDAGTPPSIAVREIALARRGTVKRLLAAAQMGPSDCDLIVSVLDVTARKCHMALQRRGSPRAGELRARDERLLQAALTRAGVPQRSTPILRHDLGRFRAAFACNASGLQPVVGVDTVAWGVDTALMARLAGVLEASPWEPLA